MESAGRPVKHETEFDNLDLSEAPDFEQLRLRVDASLFRRFSVKLAEYKQRDAARFALQGQGLPTPGGMNELIRFSRVMTLEAILGIAGQRDTRREPIGMADAATMFYAMTNVDVRPATRVPPVVIHGKRGPWTTPYVPGILLNSGLEPAAFADAYALCCKYAGDRDDLISGGTGLPPLPEQYA